MSSRSTITTPPKPLSPRQTYNPNDYYDLSSLSSLYSELSLLYPDVYSSLYTNDASLSRYYSSLLKSYSLDNYGLPTLTAASTGPDTAGFTTRTNAGVSSTGAAAAPATSSGEAKVSNSGLSTGAKIGIGIGVTSGVLLLVGLGIGLWCMGKRKGKKSSTTVVAPSQFNPAMQQQPLMGSSQGQGYIPAGLQQQQYVPSPTQYAPQPQVLHMPGPEAPYGGYEKVPGQNVVELEQEYHFTRPGVVEMGNGSSITPVQPAR
ncbi:unnamed protein product [Periconia digitata]|uniref:Uncharacterized protein n=1 Tax=Periconia digitata TaxID=1303443 RepID=A0A9W4UH16_9PLEO|nr:unnamed protein product [Periconia digitata]